ncbi:phospholipase D-like domain-containing protein [Paraflavitalea sp. CAU 1676]|uniref:phospholipase D-like domain-containing protein n=1 Tax=Paraflavitalea sp. CAU 1676 TaxID=3032598 RepID=UPI0023DC00F2|nr:phospholipase D-like domain-containing protein [Paraflavitalea sp. CAU 1676]MDF2189528.1 phospholipase D-like domain-containing protein [Paraflavitalea sp. CAU 1676]
MKLIRGGKEYFTLLLSLIEQAERFIHLQVYIYDEDDTGRAVAEALMAAAKRGVAVYLLPDGYASQNMSKPFIKTMEEAGIRFRYFQPILKSDFFYFGRRLHHKLLVIDGRHSLVGGINISNKYNDGFGHPAWLDWALYSEGDIVPELVRVSLELWTRFRKDRRSLLWQADAPEKRIKQVCPIRLRRNDWVQKRSQITTSYLEMFKDARSHIYIMSSYFLPGMLLRKKMARAARRGVKIRLVLAGISDVKLAKHAERYIYRWIFKNNIEVYEYNHSVLHAKIATYDGKWCTIGSYNVNNISAFASIELNLDVHQEAIARSMQGEIECIIREDCERITEEDFRTRYNFFKRLFQHGCYQVVRVLFFLFTFYFKQRSFKSANASK